MFGRTISIGAAASALALVTAAPALADPGNGNLHGNSHASHKPAGPNVVVVKVKPAKRAKACPPGLAKKNTGCLPPGLWKKGDLLPADWVSQFIRYGALPDFYRSRYALDPNRRYLYRDDRVIVVDAVTRTIVDIIIR